MALRTLFLLFPYAGILVAGCVAPGGPGELPSNENLTMFVATYEVAIGSSEIHVEARMENPSRIMDRDGELREAYALRVTTTSESGTFTIVYHLDGDLRVVRMDDPCQRGEPVDHCQYAEIDWLVQGTLAPFGIGLIPGPMAYQVGGAPVEARPRLWDEAGLAWIGFPSDAPSPAEPFLDMRNARLGFEGKPVATRIYSEWFPGSPGEARLVGFEPGEALASILPWPKTLPMHSPRAMTPVEQDRSADPFMLGANLGQAFDFLLANEPRARGLLHDGGCVSAHSLSPIYASIDAFTALQSRPRASYSFEVVDRSGSGLSWTVLYSTGITGEDQFKVQGEEPAAERTSCQSAALADERSENLTSFTHRVLDLPMSRGEVVSLVFDDAEPVGNPYARPMGLGRFSFAAVPRFVDEQGLTFYRPYHALMSANTGWWRWMQVHPSDIAALDGLVTYSDRFPGPDPAWPSNDTVLAARPGLF